MLFHADLLLMSMFLFGVFGDNSEENASHSVMQQLKTKFHMEDVVEENVVLLTVKCFCPEKADCHARGNICKSNCGFRENVVGTCCDENCCTPCSVHDGCTCRAFCFENEIEDGNGKCCNSGDKCCRSCTDDVGCRCGTFCLENEIEDGSGKCCNSGDKCCRPCIANDVCKNGGNGICSSSCTAEFPVDNGPCCSGGGRCCLRCDYCTNAGGLCVSKNNPCPAGKNYTVGECCDNLKCCASEPPCSADFTTPRRCIDASDPSCGTSGGGSVATGFCPFSHIKCCPYCGHLYRLEVNGTCIPSNNHCTNSVAKDCCQNNKCCY